MSSGVIHSKSGRASECKYPEYCEDCAESEILRLRRELAIKKQRIRFLEKANESLAEKFEKLRKHEK